MRRTIIQKSFIAGQQIAVEPLAEGVEILDYKFEQIGKIIFGYVHFMNTEESLPANTKLLKMSGLPQMLGRATAMQAHDDGTGGGTANALENSDEGLWLFGGATKNQHLYINFQYMKEDR